MQTLFAICRAGVSEEQPKIRKSLASREFMVARSARSLRLAKKREEEQAAAAPLKTRARVCPHSILGTAVGGSLTFRLADAFGTTFCP